MVNFYFFVQCSSGIKITMVLLFAQLDLLWFFYPRAPVGLGRRWHQRVAGLADGLAGNRRHGGDLAALGTGEPPAIGVFTATAKIFIYLYLYIYNVVIKSSEGMWLLVKMIQSLKVWGHSERFTFEDKYYFPPLAWLRRQQSVPLC